MKKKNKITGIWFFMIVALGYLALFIFYPDKTVHALSASLSIFLKIVPVVAAIIVFTAVINYLISPGKISKYLGRGSGIRGWLIAACAGILSHGAIYLWYDLLKELREKGMSRGLMAVFLYNRAVKIPLIPIMVHYFGISFVIVLSFYTVVGSYAVGILMNFLGRES